MDAQKNLATSLVATAPSPASSGTSLVVTAGHGTRFPAAPFNVTIYPAGSTPDPSNAEIARCTVKATDTFTITRAQEGTTARSVVVGDVIIAGPTVKSFTDIGWELIEARAGGTAVTAHDFLNLGDYNEIMVQMRDVTRSSAVTPYVQVSTDNGSTWLSATSDYPHIDSQGGEVPVGGVGFFQTGNSAARSGRVTISGFNRSGSPKLATMARTDYPSAFIPNTSVFNAIRITQGSGATMTDGFLYVFGRR